MNQQEQSNLLNIVPQFPYRLEVILTQLQMPLIFTAEQASKILAGMPISTIREHVHAGRLQRCEHLGDRPWFFTMEQLQNFINNRRQNEN